MARSRLCLVRIAQVSYLQALCDAAEAPQLSGEQAQVRRDNVDLPG